MDNIKQLKMDLVNMVNNHSKVEKPKLKPLIYISHPSSGLQSNADETAEIVRQLYKNDDIYNNFCIVSPIHCYGFMYDDTDYYKGLSFCTDLMMHCSLVLLCGNWKNSVGCKEEKRLCDVYGIPYMEIKDLETLKQMEKDGICKRMLSKVK